MIEYKLTSNMCGKVVDTDLKMYVSGCEPICCGNYIGKLIKDVDL